jgi:hypothetical protein
MREKHLGKLAPDQLLTEGLNLEVLRAAVRVWAEALAACRDF